MKILAIDTSCDETSVAICEDGRIMSNVISSQVRYHKKFGGVVPFLAQRLHQERIDAVVELAFQRAGIDIKDIDAIAVTQGPGLAPALQVGIAKAKQLAHDNNLPLYAVNHMVGHIASCFAQIGQSPFHVPPFPLLALLVSGKHTEMVYSPSFGNWQILGQTVDDALGEAYDKVARMVGLGYPGGRSVSLLAEQGDPTKYILPIPMRYSGDLNVSYSGLKNAVRLLVKDLTQDGSVPLIKEQVADICAAFQDVAQQAILIKLRRVLDSHPEIQSVALAGGVAANTALRKKMRTLLKEYSLPLLTPRNLKLCTDNAAMIGVAAFLGIRQGQQPVVIEDLDRVPNLPLS